MDLDSLTSHSETEDSTTTRLSLSNSNNVKVTIVPEELRLSKRKDCMSQLLRQLQGDITHKLRLSDAQQIGGALGLESHTNDYLAFFGASHGIDVRKQCITEKAFDYVTLGNLGDLFDILLEHPNLVNEKSTLGSSLLHCAIEKGNVDITNVLLSRGADCNATDGLGNQPLHLAMRRSDMPIIDLLLERGANVLAENHNRVQPIHVAADVNFVDGLKRLLTYNDIDVDCRDDIDSTPIHYCCTADSDACLELLINYVSVSSGWLRTFDRVTDQNRLSISSRRSSTASSLLTPESSRLINLLDGEGFAPIHTAVNSGNIELIRLCLQRGAKLLSKDLTGNTPLHFSCTRGDMECTRLLLNERPELKLCMIRESNNDGRTPIHLAAMHDYPELIDYLLLQGAEMNPRDRDNLTPLLLACSKGAIRATNHLIIIGADLTLCDHNDRNLSTLLLLGGSGEARETVPNLMKTNKLPILLNQSDRWGCSYMHVATRLGLKVAVRIGLMNEAKLLVRDSERSTPLHAAAQFGRVDICQQMLRTNEGKRAMFLSDQMGRIPLHVAAQHGQNRVLKLLLQNGCLCRRCHDGNSPLHYASISGNAETCEILLTFDPSLLNENNHYGASALHFATMHQNAEVTSYLLTAGIDIVPNQNGLYFTTYAFHTDNYMAAKAIATHDRFPEVFELLRSTDQCPLSRLIRFRPSLCLLLMDKYVSEIGTRSTAEHGTKFDFSMLQPFPKDGENTPESPLSLVKLMVQLKREELLTHPLTATYLQMKWTIYGQWIQILLTIYHLSTCFVITWYALNQPTSTMDKEDPNSEICSEKFYGSGDHGRSNRFVLIAMLCGTCLHLIYKGVAIATQKWQYFKDWTNWLLFVYHLFSAVNSLVNLFGEFGPHCVSMTVIVMFIAWFNFLLQLLRFEFIGIFVIMFIQVAKTIFKSASVLSILFIAFAVTLHKLFTLPEKREFEEHSPAMRNRLAHCFLGFEHLNHTNGRSDYNLAIQVYGDIRWALFQTLMMMVGEYDHMEMIVGPYLDGQSATIYTPALTFAFLTAFIFLVPISLMNLMIGLAVGDIDKVRRNAAHQLIAQQVYWLDNIEARFPGWVYRKMYVSQWICRPAIALQKRDPHIDEIQREFIEMTEELNQMVTLVQEQSIKLEQMVQQMEISKYETEVDNGDYREVIVQEHQ